MQATATAAAEPLHTPASAPSPALESPLTPAPIAPVIDLRRPTPAVVAPAHRRLWIAANTTLAALALLPTLVRLLSAAFDPTTIAYPLGEWLLNSGGGTTRRSLGGDLLAALPGSPQVSVILWCLTLAAAVIGCFAVLVRRAVLATHSPWPLLFWLMPAGLLLSGWQAVWGAVPADASVFALRKEYYFFLVLLTLVLLVGSPSFAAPLRRVRTAAVTGGFLAVGAMLNEGLALPATVFTAVYFWHILDPAHRRLALRWVCWPPSFAAGLALGLTPPGGPNVSSAWSTLGGATAAWLDGTTADRPFRALGLSMGEAMDYVQLMYFEHRLAVPFVVAGVILAAWLLGLTYLVDRSRAVLRTMGLTLALGVLAFVPLFLVAADWGRWVVAIGVFASILSLARIAQGTPTPRPTAVSRRSLTAAGVLVVVALCLAIAEFGTGFPLAQALLDI